MAAGEKVIISCITSTDIDDEMNWYQQKPGEAPKLLFSEGNTRRPGVPSQFSSNGYGTDFVFTIDNAISEDIADYYYLQSYSMPLTVYILLQKPADAVGDTARAATVKLFGV